MIVGKEIALEAKKKNICQEWFKRMTKQNDIKPLCDMYFKGDDWAMENDFPNVEILRKFRGNSEKYGLFTDWEGGMKDIERAAFFGNSKSYMEFENYSLSKVIVRHNSRVTITAKDHAIIYVNLLDDAVIEVEAEDFAQVIIYQYGSTSKFTVSGNVDIKTAEFK